MRSHFHSYFDAWPPFTGGCFIALNHGLRLFIVVVLEVRKDLCASLAACDLCPDSTHDIDNCPHVRIAVFSATIRAVDN
jgi:hypothetical protein